MILPIFLAFNSLNAPSGSVDMFVGTYTVGQASKGIYRVTLDTKTGELSTPVLAAEAVNPSYLALDSKGRFLYAVNESSHGEVMAFRVTPDRGLTKLNTQVSQGSDPCHLCVSPGGKTVLVANYSSGNVVSLPVHTDGSLGSVSENFQNRGTGPNHDRQEGPHMHMVLIDPHKKYAYACDLGTDEVLRFPFSKGSDAADLSKPERLKSPSGAGPRHAVIDPAGKILYVNNELENAVSVFDLEAAPVKEVQNLTSLSPDGSTHISHTAEIVLHPNGKWLYVSNRGYDSIAQYAVGAGGRLKLEDVYRLAVHEPRGFAIDPTGKWLVVGGQHSNNLASLEIDQNLGSLKPEKSIIHLAAPVSVLFAKG